MKVAVIGGGVTGGLTALEAIGHGWAVTLFDAPDALHCSSSAAGMLSPYAELETADETIFNLGMRSLDRWPALLERLPRAVYFRREGSLLTAHGSDLPMLRQLVALIERKSGKRLAPLSSADLRELEPDLPHCEAVYLPREGQIDAQGFLEAVTELLSDLRGFRHVRVVRIRAGEIELETGESESFDWVFDCRGFGARVDMPDLRGVRGEIIWVHAPAVSIRRPVRLMHPRYRLYVVPRPGHLYLVGATEIETEDRSPLSVRSALELLSALFSLQPEFAEARIVKTDVNLRPAFPDNRPRIEHDDGVTRMNGMFRHGYLIAPAIVHDAVTAVANEVRVHAAH